LLEGVYVPLITPFAGDGGVALDAIERLCHEYLEAGCAGIVALGTTGESSALDASEQRAVIDTCARVCAERGAQLVVGAGTNSTAKTVAAAPRDFCVLGGDDLFLLPTVLMGGAGAICASAHVCTDRFVAMTDCGLAGKVDDGRAHAEALLPVVEACFAEPNPSVFKGVLHAQGRIPTPDVRLPLVAASSGAVERAVAAVEAVR
jgi:dihydrodipicolinate synthase/N-acetylneuraminate lyase